MQKEVPERFRRRYLPLMGPGWTHKSAAAFLLDRGTISWEDIRWSFQPSCVLPADTFLQPVRKMNEAWEQVGLPAGSTLAKDSINALVGMMVAADEPHACFHWAGTNLAERPQGLWRQVLLTEHTRDVVCDAILIGTARCKLPS